MFMSCAHPRSPCLCRGARQSANGYVFVAAEAVVALARGVAVETTGAVAETIAVVRAIGAKIGATTGAAAETIAADKVIDVLAAELAASGGDYLLGASFSAADILLVHCLGWAEVIGWGERWKQPQDDAMHCLAAYAARCRARPAYIRARALP